MPTTPPGSHVNSAATLVTLLLARSLTGFEDDRIPEQLPLTEPDIQAAIAQLERAAADYAERAYGAQTVADEQARAWAVVMFTRTATDTMAMAQSFAQTTADDYGTAHIAAEAALLSVLTWRLCTGTDRDLVATMTLCCATFTAGGVIGEKVLHGDLVARGRAAQLLQQAYAERSEAATLPAAAQFARALARDALSIGVECLAIRDLERARRFLTFASLHGVTAAGALVPATHPRDNRGTPEPGRIDFATEPQRWRVTADEMNRSVVFHAASGPESTTATDPDDAVPLPCMEIAGVQVYAYLHGRTGALRVAVDLDTANAWLQREDDTVPLEVTVQGETVFAG